MNDPGRMPEAETVPGLTEPMYVGKEKKQEGVGTPVTYLGLEDALSLERFGRYLGWAEDNREKAFELYALNTALSEALYTPLQILEVALRNRIHVVMTAAYDDQWFHSTILKGNNQLDQVAEAVSDIQKEGKDPTPSRVVAALTFSFWTSMVGYYHEDLWQQTLKRIAKKANGKGLTRKDFSGPLDTIRRLRNRIAHHEPILKMELVKLNDQMLQLTEWLSPVAAEWCKAQNRFTAVYPTVALVLYEEPKPEKALESGAALTAEEIKKRQAVLLGSQGPAA